MTKFALRNPILIFMLSIAAVVFSFVVVPRMAVDTFPELTPPVLIVGTQAPGLGPKDVEKTITWRIEKYVSCTPGIEHVESVSRNGLSIVYVWLKWGTDLNGAQTLVQQQTAFAMSSVPKSLGVLPPFVLQYDPSNAPVVQVGVASAAMTPSQLYDYAQNNIEPVLEGINGVASAPVDGGQLRQINVIVDPLKSQTRGLSALQIAGAVASANSLLPSGEFISPHFDANVYTNAVPENVKSIGDAPIVTKGDRQILIRDVSRVEDGGAPPTQNVTIDGGNAVTLNVFRVPGGNTLSIVEQVNKSVDELRSKLPEGMTINAIFDQSTYVRTSYDGLKKEVLQALFLIALVILLFLQSMRGTIIVSVAIPLSFGITLIVLYATGQTLNAFTLGGLTLAMGRLVDDAVVVLESIHRHQSEGMPPRQAALAGAQAVALPVLASTLTTIAVLFPVVLLNGLAQKLFAPLAITVAVAMIASYFVSLTVTPIACSMFLGHAKPGKFAQRIEAGIDAISNAYARSLSIVLTQRVAVALAAAAIIVGSGWLAARLPTSFFPEIDESMDTIYVRLTPGTPIDKAASEFRDMALMLKKEMPEVERVVTNVGAPALARSALYSTNAGPHMGFIRLQFSEVEKRSKSQRFLADRARTLLQQHYPGVETLQAPGGLVASVFSNGVIAPLAIEVTGDTIEEIDAQIEAVAKVATTVPGLRDLYPTVQTAYPEIHVDIDRQLAGIVDIQARSVAETTLAATVGNINAPSVWVDASNGMSYYVVTGYDRDQVTDKKALSSLPVKIGAEGQAIALDTYGVVRRSVGPILVERSRLQRVGHLLMQTEGRDLGAVANDLEKKLQADPLTRDIHYRFVGQVDLMRTTFSGLGLAITLAIMVVYMIMASQFASLRLPFVMLFTIPVSLIGIVTALAAANLGFSITAFMGALMVVGIAVSNGILMVDDAARRLNEGVPGLKAIVDAARGRFRPIVMTSLATIIGLLPTAMGLEAGSASNRPLALVVVGGLTSSTLLSLYLLPVIFLWIAKPAKKETEEPHLVEAHGAAE